jgi:phosphatidylglycerol:prolipoprotein diacylglycerol transferase
LWLRREQTGEVALIPYIQQPGISLGPIRLQAFGAILMTAVLVGEALYRRRLRQVALDIDTGMALAWYILVAGFVGAHLFSLILYFPSKLAHNPLLLFKVWEDVSSFGGMIGGALGAVLYLRMHATTLSTSTRWAYLDAVAFVAPFGWAIGRVACSLAHDHPGGVTSFPLAISLSTQRAQSFIARVYADAGQVLPPLSQPSRLGFHDLGWYEFLYLTLIVVPLFVWLDHRRPEWLKRSGAWVMTFVFVYAPMRLVMDTLRISDVRYLALTPGQYAAGILLVGALYLALRQQARVAAA